MPPGTVSGKESSWNGKTTFGGDSPWEFLFFFGTPNEGRTVPGLWFEPQLLKKSMLVEPPL